MNSPAVGIVIALHREAQMFARAVSEDGGVTRIDDRLLVCVSGVGAARADAAARRLLANGATALLSWGVSGALVSGLRTGTLLLPHTIVDAGGASLSVGAQWRHCLDDVPSADARQIAETTSILSTPEQKSALARSHHAVAADMESAAVARAAQQARVPFLAVRAVCDDCAMSVPVWLLSCADARGRIDLAKLCKQLVRHPRDGIDVSRLVRGFNAALAALSGFKTRHLQQLLVTAGG
jgi:adenosylhomocysteine nucleosidase